MINFLRLRLEQDDDGSAQLFVEASCGSYSGAGSAWFGMQQLHELGRLLQATFPIAADKRISLEGGFWDRGGSGTLEQRHVALRFYPVGATGVVGVGVSLATPLHSTDRAEAQSSVAFELCTNYEALRRFGAAIEAVAAGTTDCAELVCDASKGLSYP